MSIAAAQRVAPRGARNTTAADAGSAHHRSATAHHVSLHKKSAQNEMPAIRVHAIVSGPPTLQPAAAINQHDMPTAHEREPAGVGDGEANRRAWCRAMA